MTNTPRFINEATSVATCYQAAGPVSIQFHRKACGWSLRRHDCQEISSGAQMIKKNRCRVLSPQLHVHATVPGTIRETNSGTTDAECDSARDSVRMSHRAELPAKMVNLSCRVLPAWNNETFCLMNQVSEDAVQILQQLRNMECSENLEKCTLSQGDFHEELTQMCLEMITGNKCTRKVQIVDCTLP